MPKVFGLGHIIYLVITVAATVAGLVLIRKLCKTEKSKNAVLRISAVVLLILIAWNRISIALVSGKTFELIPPSFCGLTSFLLAVAVLVIRDRNHPVYHCLIYISFLAILAVFYPDFLGQAPSIFHSRTISGLLHHSMSVLVALLLILVGGFRPSLKKWYCLPLGLCVYIAHGLFLLQIFSSGNPMLIVKPLLPSTPLTWYNLGAMFVVLQLLSVFLYEIICRKLKDKKSKIQ